MRKIFLVIPLFLCVGIIWNCKNREKNLLNVDLLNPLEDAELTWNSEFIDIGSPSFHDALLGGWGKERSEGSGTTSARAVSRNSFIVFYRYAPDDLTMQIRCKASAGQNAQTLLLSINGQELPSQNIEAKYQIYSFHVPKIFLRSGRNYLEVYSFASGDKTKSRVPVVLDYVSFGKDRSQDKSAYHQIVRTSPAIRAPVPSSIAEYFRVPPSASLEFTAALPKNAKSLEATQISIYLDDEKNNRERVASAVLRNRMFGSREMTETIALDSFVGRIVRLTLEATPIPEAPEPQYVDWSNVHLLVPRTPEQKPPLQQKIRVAADRPNVIIYLVDCLRGDRLQPYGYRSNTSPFISQFARDSVVFRNAYSQASWTRPAITSIFTGLYPESHGTEGWYGMFPASAPTIGRELKARGYTNYGFITNINISPTFGFGKDFDQYIYYAEDRAKEGVYLESDKLYPQIADFLKRGISQPAFLYIHAMDPHEPYHPGPQFVTVPDSCKGDLEDIYWSAKRLYAKACNANLAQCLSTLYDGEVRKSDYYFGQFLNRLKDLNLYDKSLIILTGDHGESFCEHHKLQHGRSVYQPEIRVPLIVKFPHQQFGGKEIDQIARHIDVFPTILQALGLKVPASVEGSSLLSSLAQQKAHSVPVFCELNLDNLRKKAFLYEKWKLIENGEILEFHDGRYELYDIRSDPGEKKNLANTNPVLLGYVQKISREWARKEFKHPALEKQPKAVIDKETEEALKALGYLQ